MKLDFEKWHGNHNDFVVVWINSEADEAITALKKRARQICSKKGNGIAADGILVLIKDRENPGMFSEIMIINSDGSLAANCGNGLRCAAASSIRALRSINQEIPPIIEARVDNETFFCSPIQTFNEIEFVSVTMPNYQLNDELSWAASMKAALHAIEMESNDVNLTNNFGICDIGNPHVVLFDQEDDLLFKVGPILQRSPLEDGVNVHVAKRTNMPQTERLPSKFLDGIEDFYQARSWERGVGPTASCGSGTCAIAANLYQQGEIFFPNGVAIFMPGGPLVVRCEEEGAPLKLSGPAELVYTGQFDL